MEFTFISILGTETTKGDDERETLPAPAPDEGDTLPTFDFPEARS